MPGSDLTFDPELAEQFRKLDARVNEAISALGELRRRNRELEGRIAEEAELRAEAVRRLDSLLDRIDALL
jgi:uncharacterized coiled-coil DUF342 family protein